MSHITAHKRISEGTEWDSREGHTCWEAQFDPVEAFSWKATMEHCCQVLHKEDHATSLLEGGVFKCWFLWPEIWLQFRLWHCNFYEASPVLMCKNCSPSPDWWIKRTANSWAGEVRWDFQSQWEGLRWGLERGVTMRIQMNKEMLQGD